MLQCLYYHHKCIVNTSLIKNHLFNIPNFKLVKIIRCQKWDWTLTSMAIMNVLNLPTTIAHGDKSCNHILYVLNIDNKNVNIKWYNEVNFICMQVLNGGV